MPNGCHPHQRMNEKPTIVLLKAGRNDFAAKAFERWLHPADGSVGWEVVEVATGAMPERKLSEYAGVLISGSSAMVTEKNPWAVSIGAWLGAGIRAGTNPPILGVCFGHQLLSAELGGVVDWCGRRHLGTMELFPASTTCSTDDLFGPVVSNVPSFMAQVAHRQCVHELSPGAVPLVVNEDKRVYAARLAPRVWGTQYHPEMSARVVQGIVEFQKETLVTEGVDIEARLKSIKESPVGPELLVRFGRVCVDWWRARLPSNQGLVGGVVAVPVRGKL